MMKYLLLGRDLAKVKNNNEYQTNFDTKILGLPSLTVDLLS